MPEVHARRRVEAWRQAQLASPSATALLVTSLANDFLPSSWAHYSPTAWDWLLYAGTFGLFLTAFLLFLRFIPMISIFEVKTLLPQAKIKADH